MVGSSLDIGDGKYDIYWGWIKAIVSNALIDCSIKTRIFQDYLVESEHTIDLEAVDKQSLSGLTIGKIHTGNFNLTIRGSCNKIIHAKKSYPSWTEKQVGSDTIKYWNGSFHFLGTKDKGEWHLELYVHSWAKALTVYHDILSSSEGRLYIGQDF